MCIQCINTYQVKVMKVASYKLTFIFLYRLSSISGLGCYILTLKIILSRINNLKQSKGTMFMKLPRVFMYLALRRSKDML